MIPSIKLISGIIGQYPYMSYKQAETISAFIDEENISSVLELGFRHGVSTCYMAACLAKKDGRIESIDLLSALKVNPTAASLLEKLDLRHVVRLYYEPTSYTWRLMRMLEEDPKPRFDLCYIDGAHDWFVDGLAFFLVDKLLKPGGWIIFDDVDWTFASSPSLADSEYVKRMPKEEKETAQIRKVYDLLVRTHPSYGNFKIERGWAYAQKIK